MKGADVFLGLSAKDVVNREMIKSMAKNPIIFACAQIQILKLNLK